MSCVMACSDRLSPLVAQSCHCRRTARSRPRITSAAACQPVTCRLSAAGLSAAAPVSDLVRAVILLRAPAVPRGNRCVASPSSGSADRDYHRNMRISSRYPPSAIGISSPTYQRGLLRAARIRCSAALSNAARTTCRCRIGIGAEAFGWRGCRRSDLCGMSKSLTAIAHVSSGAQSERGSDDQHVDVADRLLAPFPGDGAAHGARD